MTQPETRSRSGSAGPEAKRNYTVTDKVRTAGRLNLEKARAVGRQVLYRRTVKRLAACRANLLKARKSPNHVPGVRHGLRAVDLRRSALQVGESREELDRHLELVESVVPGGSEREQNAVRGLGQALWRRRRVFGSRAHRETWRFYQELEKAAEDGLTASSLADLSRALGDLFQEGEDPRLEEMAELLDKRLERVAQAYLTEWAGHKISFGALGQYRHSEPFLDSPPEAIGNGLVRPGQVVRQLKRKPVQLSQTDEWAWPEAEEGGGGAGLRLLREWARQGYRLPDPRREGDFALHLRLLEAAFFGDRDSGFGLENGNSKMETGLEAGNSKMETGKGDEFPVSNFQFPKVSPELRDAVRKLAEATWQRLQVFCRQAEKEARKLRERLEQAEAGTLPGPLPLGGEESEDAESRASVSPAIGHGQEPVLSGAKDGRATNEEEPEPQWLVERLIGVFIFSEANEAFQAAEAWNRRVEEAFRGLEGALQKALE